MLWFLILFFSDATLLLALYFDCCNSAGWGTRRTSGLYKELPYPCSWLIIILWWQQIRTWLLSHREAAVLKPECLTSSGCMACCIVRKQLTHCNYLCWNPRVTSANNCEMAQHMGRQNFAHRPMSYLGLLWTRSDVAQGWINWSVDWFIHLSFYWFI